MGIRIDSEWKKRLRKAEFRGVPFDIDSHEFEGGRNPVGHSTPGSDQFFAEDLGRKGDGFTIRGHILGDDYFLTRDALEAALKKEGKGILKHPYLGIKDVQVDGFRIREDTQQGRYASFVIRFIEAGAPLFPQSIFNEIASFFNEINEGIDIAQTAFESVYSLANLPGYVAAQMVTTIKTVASDIEDAINKVNTLPEKRAEFFKILQRLHDVGDTGGVDVTDGTDIAETTLGLLEAMGVVATDVELANDSAIDLTSGKSDKLTVYDPLLDGPDEEEEEQFNDDTPTNEAAKKNYKAIQDLVKQGAALSLAKLAVANQPDSQTEALELQQKIVGLFDEIITTAGDDTSGDSDELYQKFKNGASETVKVIPSPNLKDLVDYETQTVLPTLFLTYEIYGSLDLETDLIDRNDIRNPAFVPAQVLSVLSG